MAITGDELIPLVYGGLTIKVRDLASLTASQGKGVPILERVPGTNGHGSVVTDYLDNIIGLPAATKFPLLTGARFVTRAEVSAFD